MVRGMSGCGAATIVQIGFHYVIACREGRRNPGKDGGQESYVEQFCWKYLKSIHIIWNNVGLLFIYYDKISGNIEKLLVVKVRNIYRDVGQLKMLVSQLYRMAN